VHHCPNSGTLGGTYGEKVPWGWPLPKPDFVGECYLHTGEFYRCGLSAELLTQQGR